MPRPVLSSAGGYKNGTLMEICGCELLSPRAVVGDVETAVKGSREVESEQEGAVFRALASTWACSPDPNLHSRQQPGKLFTQTTPGFLCNCSPLMTDTSLY